MNPALRYTSVQTQIKRIGACGGMRVPERGALTTKPTCACARILKLGLHLDAAYKISNYTLTS